MTQIVKFQIDESWYNVLKTQFEGAEYKKLMAFLKSEKEAGNTIYPPEAEIFNAFNLCPFDAVKCVIIGQDPYHGLNQAHGLSFSVKQGKIPPSLRNIFKEIENDLGIEMPSHGDLTFWAKQGVLLLNTTLTVVANHANSHKKIGWVNFTDSVIKAISDNKENVVFMLWGNFAKKKAKLIDGDKHLILEAAHPVALYGSLGLKNCKHFSKANEYLEKNQLSSIDWNIK